MAPRAMPAVAPLTEELVFCVLGSKTPLLLDDDVDVAEVADPVPEASEPLRVEPGIIGIAGLM